MMEVRLRAAAISLVLAPAALYGVEGTGSDVAEFTPEPGLNIVEISVSGNRDEIGPENFLVTCTGVSAEDSLVANAVASSWSGRSLVRVESPRVLCEVTAAQQARWRITFVSQGTSSGTSDSPSGQAAAPAARQLASSRPMQSQLPMSEWVSGSRDDWELNCRQDQLTGETTSCTLASPQYWSVGDDADRGIGTLFVICEGPQFLMVPVVGRSRNATRIVLGGSEPFAIPAGEPGIDVDASWPENEIAFEAVDDLQRRLVWRVPPPRGGQADDFSFACSELEAP